MDLRSEEDKRYQKGIQEDTDQHHPPVVKPYFAVVPSHAVKVHIRNNTGGEIQAAYSAIPTAHSFSIAAAAGCL
jgi:hypothetical protein